jgi:hypothetical protein
MKDTPIAEQVVRRSKFAYGDEDRRNPQSACDSSEIEIWECLHQTKIKVTVWLRAAIADSYEFLKISSI